MGNCVKKQSSVKSPATVVGNKYYSGDRKGESSYSGEGYGEKMMKGTTTEVKIKITRKQLEELLGMKGLTVEEMLDRLIDAGDEVETQSQPWRPALQSIPE